MNINQLLELVIERSASDLHLVVNYPPLIRMHGELFPVAGALPLTDSDLASVILQLLNPEQKAVLDSKFELDIGMSYKNLARFRVNIFREQGHLAAALRYIPNTIPFLENLGLPSAVSQFAHLRQGLILVTGPTGHGKTTTLAAIINQINQLRAAHVITIEDPIEYVYPKGKALISQREMLVDTHTWANALRSVLREDPDVVLVGEMRDYETIAAAITVAETGHLVFATLHTNSAAQTIDRIIDVFPENQQSQIRLQLAFVLEAIVSQRLIPTVQAGRALAVELLLKTPALASMVREAKSHLIDNLIQTSAELGMVSLEGSLTKLVKEGRISLEVAQSFSLHPEMLAKLVGDSV